jgi:hypothetical protein
MIYYDTYFTSKLHLFFMSFCRVWCLLYQPLIFNIIVLSKVIILLARMFHDHRVHAFLELSCGMVIFIRPLAFFSHLKITFYVKLALILL